MQVILIDYSLAAHTELHRWMQLLKVANFLCKVLKLCSKHQWYWHFTSLWKGVGVKLSMNFLLEIVLHWWISDYRKCTVHPPLFSLLLSLICPSTLDILSGIFQICKVMPNTRNKSKKHENVFSKLDSNPGWVVLEIIRSGEKQYWQKKKRNWLTRTRA